MDKELSASLAERGADYLEAGCSQEALQKCVTVAEMDKVKEDFDKQSRGSVAGQWRDNAERLRAEIESEAYEVLEQAEKEGLLEPEESEEVEPEVVPIFDSGKSTASAGSSITMEEIRKMKPAEWKKNEKAIIQMAREGKIK